MKPRLLASIAILLTVGSLALNEIKPAQADTDNTTSNNTTSNNNTSESSSDFAASIITFGIFAGGFALFLPEMKRKQVGKEVAVKVDQIMSLAGDKEYVKGRLKLERNVDSNTTHINVYFQDKNVYKASCVVEQENPKVLPTSNPGIQEEILGTVRIEVEFIEFDENWLALLNKEWENTRVFLKELGMT